MTTTVNAPSPTLRRRRALTVLGAVLAAGGVRIVLRVSGLDLAVAAAGGAAQVGLPAVVATALAAGLAGWAVLAGLERWARRPHRTWRALAVGVLVLSLLGPVTSALTPSAAGGLIALHVATGVALLALPAGRLRRR
jgi:hypothetical protein